MTRDFEVYNKDDSMFHNQSRSLFVELVPRSSYTDCDLCYEIVASLNFVRELERKLKIELLLGPYTKQEEFDKLVERLFDEKGRCVNDASQPQR